MKNELEGFQVTDIGNKSIQVIVQDIETKKELRKDRISRAKLAKLMHEGRVVGAKNGLFIIEQ